MTVAVAAGVVLGVLYTLSPLTVLSLVMIAAAAWFVARTMSPRERSWFLSVLGVAVALRLVAIAGLFLLADPTKPFASFFGDEELFKQRTIWLRNVFTDVPISPADIIYVFDRVGQSSYLYLLAYIQALVGDAPYGLNVLNASWYVLAVLILYRLARQGYGRAAALLGMVVLLFIPTLFSWSISVLKESLYILLAAIELTCAVYILRARRVWLRVAAAIAVIGCAVALQSVRVGGHQLVLGGVTLGLAAAVLLTSPRRAVVTLALAPIVVLAVALHPRVQERVLAEVRDAAFQHAGHVATPGYSYRLLEPHYYAEDRSNAYRLTPREAARYTIRALASFITVPRPSQIQSRATLAYVPEQALWYAMLIMLPLGVIAGWRSDPVLTAMLLAHGVTAAAMVALTSGNIGTLTRHRGLVLPYVTWLAAMGACHLIDRIAVRRPATAAPVTLPGEYA
jgi:4-amino-4-deoxy-L-arabinose transferase-like glycosyltransferase